MYLKKLSLQNFRCYRSLDQVFSKPVNIIDGDNGSGKTALIEAIYWQSTGRSFRHHKNVDLIQHDHDYFSVYSEYQHASEKSTHKLGVRYSGKQKKQIKYNGELIRRQTRIAQAFPVIAIDPGSFLWIDHPPNFRRSFLDWLVFHVEHQYLHYWKQTQKVQQHINQLLKKGATQELALWQQKYSQLAQHTNQLRKKTSINMQHHFAQMMPLFLPDVNNIELNYLKGWSGDNLEHELHNRQATHLKQGFIGIGTHKADLQCLVDNQSAQVFLSRGQKKLLAIIMYLIFIEIFEQKHQQSPIILLDDIDSELDNRALALLAEYLQKKPRQLFITTVNRHPITTYFNDYDVFHVKQDAQKNACISD